jgi:hypothetical protein
MQINSLTCNFSMIIKRYTIFTLLFLLISPDSLARLRDYETTRLKSTAGTGVGSVLMDESSILNPAGLAFYTMGSIYFQKGGMTVTNSDPTEGYRGYEPKSFGVIASDASKGTGGSVSYTKQEQGFEMRKRISAALATPVTEKSAIGSTIRKTTDTLSPSGYGNDLYKERYTQFIFGITHAISDTFTLGLTAIDPLQKRPEDTRGLMGFQYAFENIITLMGDIGADYSTDPSTTLQWRAAVQVKAYNDFFVRFGTFNDKAWSERGNGAGIGWVGPKLVFEIAYKNTKIDERAELNQKGQSIKDTSFSLAYKF